VNIDNKFTQTHQPCPDCGSSDALAINADGSSKCFGCGEFTPGTAAAIKEDSLTTKEKVVTLASGKQDYSKLETATYKPIADRNLTSATAKKFNTLLHGDGSVTFGYTNDEGVIVAAKKRLPDKKFFTSGEWTTVGLFGKSLFPEGGRYITITEGEFDALACYQMSPYPTVSVKNGASGAVKDCRDSYDWLNSFENIVICFDADEPGRKAAKEVADLFGIKAKIVSHVPEYKDACDYLVANKADEFKRVWWAAKQYTPDGIIGAGTLRDALKQPLAKAQVMYPFAGLNKMLYGIRKAELVTICSGSGLGKSTLLRELVSHILRETTDNVGLMFLEETPERTMRGLVGLELNKPLHLPDCVYTGQDIDDVFTEMDYENRVYLWDAFGSNEIQNVLARMRYLVKVLGVEFIVLDHLSILVSDQANGDERKTIDMIMTKLRMFVQEMNVSLLLVSHLKRPEGKSLEDGAVTSLGMLRGSAAIAQLSDAVIGAERNSQHDDIIMRNTTKLRVLKNRYTGKTGPACDVYYDERTGRLSGVNMDDIITKDNKVSGEAL